MLRRLLGGVAVVAILGVAGLAALVRLAPEDAAAWHQDPLTVDRQGPGNSVLVAPSGLAASPVDEEAGVYAVSPEELMLAVDSAALSRPRVTRLAGDPSSLFVTYVERSTVMAFPDYVSVRALPAEGGATLAIYSRSRYGSSDMGVNGKRVSAWLEALEPLKE